MADRQDIDALLIGALYGELDDDERGRLDAHLASHPQDQAALEGMRSTRQLLVDADVTAMASAEPSPAISARLLQEAARRAPAPRAERRGVVAFLAALFRPVVAHPAMSAAAALVVVAGVAGVMYKSGRWDTAAPTAPSERAESGRGAEGDKLAKLEHAPDPARPAKGALPGAGGAADDGEQGQQFAVSMADPLTVASDDLGGREKEAATDPLAGKDSASTREGRADEKKKVAAAKPASRRNESHTGYLALDKNSDERPGVRDADGNEIEVAGSTSDRTVAPPPATPRGAAAQAPRPASPAPTAGAYDAKVDAATLAWARDQHAWMVKLVNAGKCNDAGAVGAEIARRAPEYYQANVSNDRAIRSCRAYVERARRSRQSEQSKTKAASPRAPSPDQADSLDPYESAK